MASLEWAGLSRDREIGCSRMLGMGNFPDFPGKKLVPQKQDRERRPLFKNKLNYEFLVES